MNVVLFPCSGLFIASLSLMHVRCDSIDTFGFTPLSGYYDSSESVT